MSKPTRDRTRRAGLALAAALLLALPALAAPAPPAPAADSGVEAAAERWADGFADLWQRLLAAVGVSAAGPPEPAQPLPDDDATLLTASDDKGENGPSLDPNGRL